MRTIDEIFRASRETGNSFDLVRLLAAFAVLVSHAFVLTTGTENAEPVFALTSGRLSIGYLAVGVFFSLSGFLIARSFERSTTTSEFALKRALRILPGLWVSIILTVGMVLAFSEEAMSLVQSQDLLRFLGNLVFLPVPQTITGVFSELPLKNAVNGSLWTLKYEVLCYSLVVILLFRQRGHIGVICVALLISTLVGNLTDYTVLGGWIYHAAILADLFQFFGFGMLINALASRLPASLPLAYTMLAIWLVVLMTPAARAASPALLTYPIIVIGLQRTRLSAALSRLGDLSYGTYVYAFPVQQACISLAGSAQQDWLENITLATPVTLALAFASWKLVEQPALRLKLRSAPRPRDHHGDDEHTGHKPDRG